MKFKCDAEEKKWKLEDSGCKKKIVCKAANMNVEVGNAKLGFKLPHTKKGGELREEECGEDFEGKAKFKCDGENKTWTLEDSSCKKKIQCKAADMSVKVEDAKLAFKLNSTTTEGEVREEECGEEFEGVMKFTCDAEDKKWKLEDSGCKKKIVCKAANMNVEVGNAKLGFKLPDTKKG